MGLSSPVGLNFEFFISKNLSCGSLANVGDLLLVVAQNVRLYQLPSQVIIKTSRHYWRPVTRSRGLVSSYIQALHGSWSRPQQLRFPYTSGQPPVTYDNVWTWEPFEEFERYLLSLDNSEPELAHLGVSIRKIPQRVSNCHGVPGRRLEFERLSISQNLNSKQPKTEGFPCSRRDLKRN